ncbi:MAG TPA: hypothetical protein VM118_04450, partial [Acidobacteriota bacterium]|nr:hypothetical protein [Acidobacteriota bacterium]
LDPLNPRVHLSRARIESWANRHDAARDSYAKALELSPGITSAHAGIATQYMLEGRLEDALAESNGEESTGYRSCAQSMIYHALGRTRESDEALAALKKEGKEWSYQIAMVSAYRGECDEAFAWLEQACALRDPGVQSVKVQRVFAGLHDDPRWPELLKKIGLTA